jgi:asparagine synthase (glutamine-hydrolysing)
MSRARTPDFFNQLSYLFVKFHLQEMLEIEDRCSMASSVEVRVPFLNHRLVTWVLNLPASVKVPEGQEKFLLKTLARVQLPELPEAVWRRKKSPMPPPFDVQRLVPAMAAVLRTPDLAITEYVEPGRLHRFLDSVATGAGEAPTGHRHYALFRLYFLERWHRIFLNGAGSWGGSEP